MKPLTCTLAQEEITMGFNDLVEALGARSVLDWLGSSDYCWLCLFLSCSFICLAICNQIIWGRIHISMILRHRSGES